MRRTKVNMGSGTRHSRHPLVVIDTREQLPYRFPNAVTRTLKTGDYSLLGFEDRIAIERKSKSDAYRSLGKGRERFLREIQRLSKLDYAAIVIESDLSGFLQQPLFSHLSPNSAIGSLLSWSVRYHVHVFFAGDRRHGKNLTRELLLRFWRLNEGASRG